MVLVQDHLIPYSLLLLHKKSIGTMVYTLFRDYLLHLVFKEIQHIRNILRMGMVLLNIYLLQVKKLYFVF